MGTTYGKRKRKRKKRKYIRRKTVLANEVDADGLVLRIVVRNTECRTVMFIKHIRIHRLIY